MEVKRITNNDIGDVVSIHQTSFANFFLTSLGTKFLTIYYDCVRKDMQGLLLGCYENNMLVGFCAACLYSKGFNTKLVVRNPFRFLRISLHLLFTKPMALVRLFNNFTKSNSSISDKGDYSELLSIAVDPDKQGLGIGKRILYQLEDELKANHCSRLSLTTDYCNNDKTIYFYRELGYDIMYEFISYPNRKMYRMIKKI